MILATILLFATAAAVGLSLVVLGVRYQRGSLALGLGHASIGVVALGLLIFQVFHESIHMLYNTAALLFVLTFMGGVLLLALREGRKPPPMIVVGIHAAVAIVALTLLVMGYAGFASA